MLDRGIVVGFVKPTDDPRFLGWILIKKLTVNPRIIDLFSEHEPPGREERERLAMPYLVTHLEIDRAVHESGEYETEDEYRQKVRFRFSTLEEVEAHLHGLGLLLRDARDARLIDAP